MKQEENRPYHHGDLRRVLLDAALHLVAERGIHHFTLREVARQAGVSHNAPYHHFAGKAELVVALTVEGFHMLELAMRSTYEQSAGSILERTLAISDAYMHFALEHSALYRLMFRPEFRQSSHHGQECDEAVEDAAETTFQVVRDGIAASQQAGLLRTEPSVDMMALTLWSTMHGLTMLLLDNLPIEKLDLSSLEKNEQLMAHVMHMVAQGLTIP